MPYQLTAERLQKMLKVLAVTRAMSDMRPMPEPTNYIDFSNIGDGVKALEENADMRRVLSDVDWTARDFLWTVMTTGKALLVMAMRDAGQLSDLPRDVEEANITFLLNLPPDLDAEFNAWKRAEMDPALNDLTRLP